MTAIEICLINLAVVLVPAALVWCISLALEDVSIVDILWGPLFAVLAWSTFVNTPGLGLRKVLLVGLISLWALRLAGYLAWRNLGKGEDYRYRAMRKNYGARFRWLSLVIIFGFQAVLAWIVSLPVQLGQMADVSAAPWQLTPLMAVGCGLFAVGLYFETVGDWQLARFKADPQNAGKVMDRGLWRYTRHPNYFGDFTIWWGLFAIALGSPDQLARMGWTVIGPLVMSFLLLRVSGVTLLEKALKKRRPEYEDYIRRTSAFFPWPPRRDPARRDTA